jgi:hypothetical protein
MKVSVDVDVREAIAKLRSIGDDMNKAVPRALNRVAASVKGVAARSIRDELGSPIRLKDVRNVIRVTNATRLTLTALVRAGGSRTIPASLFGAAPNRTGVSFRYRGRRVRVPHAFFGRGRLKGIFIRAKSFSWQTYPQIDFRSKRVNRTGLDYPVSQIRVPGIPAIFVEAVIADIMRKAANDRFPIEFARAVRVRGR